jgi:hypothetical protein
VKRTKEFALNGICFDRCIKGPTGQGIDIVDITSQLEQAVRDLGIKFTKTKTSSGESSSLSFIGRNLVVWTSKPFPGIP